MVTISIHESSVGIFVPFLNNLAALLDHATAHAEARKIDPSVLLNMRHYPNMYNLSRQVGEANRHAVVASALLADQAPHQFADGEPDLPELKSASPPRSNSCRACRARRSSRRGTGQWSSRSATVRSGNLPGGRCY